MYSQFHLLRKIPLLPACLLATAAITTGQAEPITFQEHLAPIFKQHCNSCHNPDKLKADLDLTSHATLMKGGSSGAAVVPGGPDASLLYKVMAHLEEPAMPPKKPKLDDNTIKVIKDWIAGGCKETSSSEAAKSRDAALNAAPSMPTTNATGPGAMPEGLKVAQKPEGARQAPVIALAASPRAPLLAVSRAESISFLNSETLAPLGDLEYPERTVHNLQFSRSGDVLIAAGGRGAHSGKAVVFDVKSGKRLGAVGDEASDALLCADISADHQRVACGSSDKQVAVYELKSGKRLFTIKKHTDWVTSVAFSPDGARLATGDRAGGLHLWDAHNGTILYTLAEHQGRITQISWRADGQILASAGDDGKLILWDTNEGWAAKSTNPSVKQGKGSTAKFPGVLSANFSGDGRVVIATRDKLVRVLTANGAPVETSKPFESLPTQVAVSYDGKCYFTGDLAGAVKSWPMPGKN